MCECRGFFQVIIFNFAKKKKRIFHIAASSNVARDARVPAVHSEISSEFIEVAAERGRGGEQC